MDQSLQRLRGVIIPAATPFDDAGDLDLAAMEENYRAWEGTGIAGYMALGSNSEFRSLTDAETVRVVEAAVQLKGDKPLIVGVGRESLRHTLEVIDSLAHCADGIDFFSVLTPGYFGKLMDGAALEEFYTAVADHSPRPVMIYVAPGFANGVTVPPASIARLADHPNIHGMKDTSTAGMVDYMVAAGGRDDFAILAGSLNTIMINLAFGGHGGVVSAANYLPAECAKLTDLFFAGERTSDRRAAYAYYAALQRLVKSSGANTHSVASLKAAMDALGFRGGPPRLPVRPLGSEQVQQIGAALERGRSALADLAS